jgi:hypothetical protein
VIGNLFTELSAPCEYCGAEQVIICGQTVTGNTGTLIITDAGFDFKGCAADAILIDKIQKERCIYAGTRAGTQRAFGIQRNCKMQGFNKAYFYDHEQYGALSEEVPFYISKQDTG